MSMTLPSSDMSGGNGSANASVAEQRDLELVEAVLVPDHRRRGRALRRRVTAKG
jgi:hypothetical protein